MAASLDLSQASDGKFVLTQTHEDGRVERITLTETSVLMLGQSAAHVAETILAGKSSGGMKAVATAPVIQVGLNNDPHHTAIVLTMIPREGAEGIRFALPLQVARALAEHLPLRIAEAEAAVRNKTLQ